MNAMTEKGQILVKSTLNVWQIYKTLCFQKNKEINVLKEIVSRKIINVIRKREIGMINLDYQKKNIYSPGDC